MSKVNNFDVLKRMAAENKTIMLCPDVLDMTYSQKQGGTKVVVGVPGNPIADILSGKKKAVLLMWDVAEFEQVAAEIEAGRQG